MLLWSGRSAILVLFNYQALTCLWKRGNSRKRWEAVRGQRESQAMRCRIRGASTGLGWLVAGLCWLMTVAPASALQEYRFDAVHALSLAGGPTSQLNDGGDGIAPAPGLNGQFAQNHWLSAEIPSSGAAPVIGTIVPPQILHGPPSAELWVDQVTTTGTIAAVWAVITPPLSPPGVPVTVPLTRVGESRYSTTYAGFTETGTYQIAIYAQDSEGNQSLPGITQVEQTQGSGAPPDAPPDAYEPDDIPAQAHLITDTDLPQRHTLHQAGDTDWVYFLLAESGVILVEAADVGARADLILELYRAEGSELELIATRTDGLPGEFRNLEVEVPEGIYYLKVTNRDPQVFGSDTEYDLRTSPLLPVPDIVGQSLAQAEILSQQAGLQVGVITFIPSATVPPGTVISQDPAAGTLVSPGSTVDLVVSVAPGGVTGRVRDAHSGQPLAGVQLRTSDGASTQSLDDGAYFLSHRAGNFTLTAELAGYQLYTDTVDIPELDIIVLNIALTPVTIAPNALAGEDRNVSVGAPVILDGSASFDPDHGPQPLSYRWSFVSVPPASTLTNAALTGANTATPTFTPDVAGDYVLQLEVSDGAASDFDNVRVTVTPPGGPQPHPPLADAGPDRTVPTGQRLTLDGSASHDPDQGPQSLRFAWTLVAAPPDSALSSAHLDSATTAQVSFTPDVAGTYQLRLEVSDGVSSATDEVIVRATSNQAPTAQAGPNQTAQTGQTVIVDGSASYDPDQGPAPLSFTWQLVTVPPGSALQTDSLTDAHTRQARFRPDLPGEYHLRLTVSDGALASSDEVVVTVTADLLLTVEEPVEDSTYSGVANVRGWALAQRGIARIELWIDGQFRTRIPADGRRPDVASAHPEFPNSQNAGFSMALNYSNLSAGAHTFTIRAVDSEGTVQDRTVPFTVTRFAKAYLADPDSISLQAASFSAEERSLSITQLLADNQPYDLRLDWRPATQRFAITDIRPAAPVTAVPARVVLDSSSLPPLSQPAAPDDTLLLTVEEPVAGSVYTGVANVHGWALAQRGIARIELWVDGQLRTYIPAGGRRPDVGAQYPDIPHAIDSGFSMALNYSNLSAGVHTFIIRAFDHQGAQRDETVAFTVTRFAEAFLADPGRISLQNARLTYDPHEAQALFITGLRAGDQDYNLRLDWQPASQGFAITEIVPATAP